MSDVEVQALRRALRRRGEVRFVALAYPTPESLVWPGAVKVTAASRCGDPGFTNLMRSNVLAFPVYVLEDLPELERAFRVDKLYDLKDRRRIAWDNGPWVIQPADDPRRLEPPESEWPQFELEEGWTDITFESPGRLRKLYRHE